MAGGSLAGEKIEAFLRELTELSHRHGLGLTLERPYGDEKATIELYDLEAEDAERRYVIDTHGELTFE